MKRKWLVLLAIVSVLIFVVAGCAPAAAPPVEKPPVEKPPVKPPVEKPPVEKIVWKFAHYTPSVKTASGAGAKWFFDEVAKRSEGRFECKFFLAASLCPAKEQPDGLKTGLFEATAFVPAYYPSKTPLYHMGNMPGIIPAMDYKEGWINTIKIFDEWLHTPPLKAELEKWNAMAFDEFYPLFYSLLSKTPIRNLEDLKGKKVYVVGMKLDLMKAAGAAPVFMVMPEIYDAISKGVVEAAGHSWEIFSGGYRWYELCDYWIYGINFGHINCCLAVSKKDYEALPEDMKKIFQEVNKDWVEWQGNHFEARFSQSMEVFKKAGIESIEWPAKDNLKLREFASDIWKGQVDKLEGQGLPAKESFNSLQDIIKKHVSGYEPYYLK